MEETGQNCSFLNSKEKNRLALQLMSLLLYYRFPIYYAHRCIRFNGEQLDFMLELLKEHGNTTDGIKYYNKFSGCAYYYSGLKHDAKFLEICTKLTHYKYPPLVISSMIKHYRERSMAIIFNLMEEGVDKDVLYELAKISSIYNSKDIDSFLHIRREVSMYNVDDNEIMEMCIKSDLLKQRYIQMIKNDVPPELAIFFGRDTITAEPGRITEGYIHVIKEALRREIKTETLLSFFSKFTPYTKCKLEDVEFLLSMLNYYTDKQKSDIDMNNILGLYTPAQVDEFKIRMRNANIKGISDFKVMTYAEYLKFLNLTIVQQNIFRMMYLNTYLHEFNWNCAYNRQKINEIFGIVENS
jgi:hypothetical protein